MNSSLLDILIALACLIISSLTSGAFGSFEAVAAGVLKNTALNFDAKPFLVGVDALKAGDLICSFAEVFKL